MSAGVITIEFSGPQGSGKSKQASKLADTLRLDGKVVRYYDLEGAKGQLPDPLPTDCHFIIIVRQT